MWEKFWLLKWPVIQGCASISCDLNTDVGKNFAGIKFFVFICLVLPQVKAFLVV